MVCFSLLKFASWQYLKDVGAPTFKAEDLMGSANLDTILKQVKDENLKKNTWGTEYAGASPCSTPSSSTPSSIAGYQTQGGACKEKETKKETIYE